MSIKQLVSGSAARLALRISRVDIPSLSIGRASTNVYRICEDIPLCNLISIIDSDPKYKLNLINMLDLQLQFGKMANSLGWCPTCVPLFTSQNGRHLNLQAADDHTKSINRKMYWIEQDDLNRLNDTIFLSRSVCEVFPSLVLVAKLEYEVGNEKRRCQTLGELLPIVKYMGNLEDWSHLSQVGVIPMDGNMSLATILCSIDRSVDAQLKNQVNSAIWLLCHWPDVTNKVSFILKQMPPTRLSELQKD